MQVMQGMHADSSQNRLVRGTRSSHLRCCTEALVVLVLKVLVLDLMQVMHAVRIGFSKLLKLRYSELLYLL
jgi:hypothetical protein